MALAGLTTTIHSLPPELLESLFGFHDVRTLCTARLVCTNFRAAASRYICSVEISIKTLRTRPWTTLNNFPNLSRVTISGLENDDLRLLALSPIGKAVTRMQGFNSLSPVPPRTPNAPQFPLLPFPNLTSLAFTVDYRVPPKVCEPPFLQTLRELDLVPWPLSHQTAKIVAGLSNLTSLRIHVSGLRTPFEEVTALTALQKLEIRCGVPTIPFVAELTLLTHLAFFIFQSFVSVSYLTSLTRLQRVVHLGVWHPGAGQRGADFESGVLESIASYTSLRSLDMRLCDYRQQSAFVTVLMTPFSQLTALRLDSALQDVTFLPRFTLERLQDLSLSSGVQLDQAGVAALSRATGLTQLELCRPATSAQPEVATALSRMSGLHALSLDITGANPTGDCSDAIRRLTDLTRLALKGAATNADVEVVLGLKKLRGLDLGVSWTPAPADNITCETIFQIAKLVDLRTFNITGKAGISKRDMTDDVWARLNSERHDRGWPALELWINRQFYGHRD